MRFTFFKYMVGDNGIFVETSGYEASGMRGESASTASAVAGPFLRSAQEAVLSWVSIGASSRLSRTCTWLIG